MVDHIDVALDVDKQPDDLDKEGNKTTEGDQDLHQFDKPKKEKLTKVQKAKKMFDFYQDNKGGFGGQDSSDLVDLEPEHSASITTKL